LIELLAVVAILTLLLTILIPSLRRARGMARAAVCTSNLRQLAVAVRQYLGENKQDFPPCSTYWYHLYWQQAGWGEPWGYWWTGPYNDIGPSLPPYCPSWMDYTAPYFGTAAVLQCPDWRWHRLGWCNQDNDRFYYGFGANANVMRYWDFNGSGGEIPGRPYLPRSSLLSVKDPGNVVLLFDRFRSDRMDVPRFANVAIGGVAFRHPVGQPTPPDNIAAYFNPPPVLGGSANVACVDGHVEPVNDVDEFNRRISNP